MAEFKSKFGLGNKVRSLRKQEKVCGIVSSVTFRTVSIFYQVDHWPGNR
jgi:hypothetical protein